MDVCVVLTVVTHVTANHQVIALYNASKRVSTIADNDNLFLFQVVPLLTI